MIEDKKAPLDVRVDPRVELISILQRLVGEREYTRALATSYVAAVDAHFKPFAQHPAVAATRELRRRSITYDAPMQLAVHLDDKLQLRAVPADPRFTGVDLESYLQTVRDFASASGFDEFFARHRADHARMTEQLRTAITADDPRAWFDSFFGERPGARFVVIAAPLNGTWIYGAHAGDEVYQILGIYKVDFDELPVVDTDILELVVHEIAHSYINPLFDKHRAALEPHGTRLFARVEEPMRKQAYGVWHIMLNELAVRAVTTLYILDRRGKDAANAAAQKEVSRSFLWTPELAKLLLTKYRADRARYPDMDAFVPEIIAFLAAQP